MASIRRLSSVLLLKYKELADDIVGYNDKYLCCELHTDTVPFVSVIYVKSVHQTQFGCLGEKFRFHSFGKIL